MAQRWSQLKKTTTNKHSTHPDTAMCSTRNLKTLWSQVAPNTYLICIWWSAVTSRDPRKQMSIEWAPSSHLYCAITKAEMWLCMMTNDATSKWYAPKYSTMPRMTRMSTSHVFCHFPPQIYHPRYFECRNDCRANATGSILKYLLAPEAAHPFVCAICSPLQLIGFHKHVDIVMAVGQNKSAGVCRL